MHSETKRLNFCGESKVFDTLGPISVSDKGMKSNNNAIFFFAYYVNDTRKVNAPVSHKKYSIDLSYAPILYIDY